MLLNMEGKKGATEGEKKILTCSVKGSPSMLLLQDSLWPVFIPGHGIVAGLKEVKSRGAGSPPVAVDPLDGIWLCSDSLRMVAVSQIYTNGCSQQGQEALNSVVGHTLT